MAHTPGDNRIVLEGEWDPSRKRELVELLGSLKRDGAATIELRGLTYADSTLLALFAALALKFQDDRITIVGPTPNVLRLLKLVTLTSCFASWTTAKALVLVGAPMNRESRLAAENGAPVARSAQAKVVAMYAALVGANAIVWVLAVLFLAPTHAVLLGTALLAYTFGLRHAVDPDHISAIDNVTRKLMQEGKQPVGVGFYFSLGHSTIVVAMTVAIVFAAGAVRLHLPGLERIGGVAGTGVSAAFLFVIAAINAFVMADVLRAIRQTRDGETISDLTLNESLERRGLLGRIFKPLLRLVARSRDMYLIGLLFGLGFDTATEVGLLGIAAIEAGKGLPIWTILLFPALFAAGMSLVDTADGILMLSAYGWAFLNPARKLYYNLTITSASVFVAVFVACVELSGALGGMQLAWLGFAIVAFFALAWTVSKATGTIQPPKPAIEVAKGGR